MPPHLKMLEGHNAFGLSVSHFLKLPNYVPSLSHVPLKMNMSKLCPFSELCPFKNEI